MTLAQHYGNLKSFPPYVGGDDDEITSWQAECACSFRGRETPHLSVANGELVAHLNEALVSYRGISWFADPHQPKTWMLELHRDGWDIEVVVGGMETSFAAMPADGATTRPKANT